MKKNFKTISDNFVRNIYDKLVRNKMLSIFSLLFFLSLTTYAQPRPNPNMENWVYNPSMIGTLILVLITVLIAVIILYNKVSHQFDIIKHRTLLKRQKNFKEELTALDEEGIDEVLEARKAGLKYKLEGDELSGANLAEDKRGIVSTYTHNPENPIVDTKPESTIRIPISNELKKLVLFFIGISAFWLIFGTMIGQYVGMKFLWPEMDKIAWLSFGRLRPVHTNVVFWGWASMSMVGLGYYVIARTSNTEIYSYRVGWISFVLMNLSVALGVITLMLGINNGGGEYREFVWPVMALFAIGLIMTFWNFYKTVANRKVKEIYISTWYLFGGLMWTITIVVIAYLPFYQNGLGETIIQGYYMHMGVGMWFMTYTLGLIYYYLPSSLNKPIYSYSLGVLAFWTQMLFYTMIGTHHFIFSPLPWWLQTIAIVFSIGMFIPVIAGTTNFLMTMKGSFKSMNKSYVLPFFLVGVIYYFVGSAQGSIQALRFTNFVWHFTDFNVAHSHMTMYGIICFILWASIYAIVPKITGRGPKQVLVGVHFWLAFIGLFAYMTSLMIGGTLKGVSWIEGKPFIESVILMQPYWVWRAVGGSLMFLSHLMFAYNFYIMVKRDPKKDVQLA